MLSHVLSAVLSMPWTKGSETGTTKKGKGTAKSSDPLEIELPEGEQAWFQFDGEKENAVPQIWLRDINMVPAWGPWIMEKGCQCCLQDWCGCATCHDCSQFLARRGYRLPQTAESAYNASQLKWHKKLDYEATIQYLPGNTTLIATNNMLYKSWSTLHEYGLFARTALAERTLLGPYVGAILGFADSQIKHERTLCPMRATYLIGLLQDQSRFILKDNISYCVVAPRRGLALINGAANEKQCSFVNTRMCQLGEVTYFRLEKNVDENAELVLDYGMSYWSTGFKGCNLFGGIKNLAKKMPEHSNHIGEL